MKKLICILAAVMLVFAVSCSNDNPSPDASTPAVNTDNIYAGMTNDQKMAIVTKFLNVLSAAYEKEYSALSPVIDEEITKAVASGSQKGTFTESNDAGTVWVKVDYVVQKDFISVNQTIYIEEYEFDGYTIWGADEEYSEYTFKENETDYVSKIKLVEVTDQNGVYKCYLNDEMVGEYSEQ